MFCGEHKLSLDEKGRMRIPNKLRAQIEGEYVLFAYPGDCLAIVPKATFDEKFASRASTLLMKDQKEQMALRRICSTACIPEEDNQGRFVLPAKLKAMAGIKKKVVFLGVIDRIEVWAEEKYDVDLGADNIDLIEAVETLTI